MIIILFPYKFNDFFYKKYQIFELNKKLKNKIEIHDVSNIVSKKWSKFFKKERKKFIIKFNNIGEWENYLIKKTKQKKIFYVVNLISSNSLKSFFIHYLLFKYKVKIIKLNSPEVYAPAQVKNLYLKLISFFKILFLNLPRLLFIIKNTFYNRLLYFLKFDELYVLFSGSKKYILPLNIRSKKKFLINFHSSDFANFLSGKKKNNKKITKNYVVLLDIKAPAFHGDDILFNNKITYNTSQWYKDLNGFLKNVEEKFNTEIIIIPHPTVRNFKNIYYDKKFKVSKDPDASNKLIANSRFVIANGATTAVSYCVMYNKPVTFIYNNQVTKFNPTMRYEIKTLCKILSSKEININQKFNKKSFCLHIYKKVYSNYKYNFLTAKKIKDIKNSEILKKLIS